MVTLTVPKVPDSGVIANRDGVNDVLGYYNDNKLFDSRVKEILEGTILRIEPLTVKFVENEDVPLFRNAPWPFEVISVTSKSASGTCTATVKIGTTALGGTANSVSSSEQIRTHTTTNTGVIGDDLTVTFSSNSSCEMATITVAMRVKLVE